jgi:hypothetical protein
MEGWRRMSARKGKASRYDFEICHKGRPRIHRRCPENANKNEAATREKAALIQNVKLRRAYLDGGKTDFL